MYLNYQGFNSDIISEQSLEMAQKFLSGTGVDALFGYFKEYAAKWLLQTFKLNPDSLLGSIFITSIGNVPIGDMFKLTDCNYAVPFFTKSLVEGLIRKFLVSKGYENPITATIRNALTDVMEDTNFVKNLEEKLSGVICPKLGGLTKKMDKVGDKLIQQGQTNVPSGLQSKASDLMSKTSDLMSKSNDIISKTSDMTSQLPKISSPEIKNNIPSLELPIKI